MGEHAPIPCVIYGAKSTPDPRASIPSQVQDCREAIAREGERTIYGEPQTDENRSAYKGNRGPGLAEAKRLVIEAAEQHGQAELWVQHSDRLARGDGLTADHLSEVYFAMRRVGVRLRSVQDDSNLEDAIRAVLIGERNTEDSRRKSEAVKSGKRREFEKGWLGGGPVPEGLRVIRHLDESDNVQREFLIDPDHAPTIRLIYDLDEQGWGAPSIPRELNRRGLRTRAGKPWTRRRVQDTLTNPVYAGAVVWRRGTPEQEINWQGRQPGLIEPERWQRLAAARAARDHSKGSNRNPRGRTFSNHALAGIACCAKCGEPMRPVTGTYHRKSDGGRRRTYLCGNVHAGTGLCDAPSIDAEAVDRHVIANLDSYLGDFEAWRGQLVTGYQSERARMTRHVDSAGEDVAKVARKMGQLERMVERQLEAGDEAKADAALAMVSKGRADHERAECRLRAAEDALASIPTDAPADAMLDFYNALGEAISGRMESADSMARVNDALRDLFECFYLDARAEGVVILPVLRSGQVEMFSLATGDDPITPPLREIRAPLAQMGNAQA